MPLTTLVMLMHRSLRSTPTKLHERHPSSERVFVQLLEDTV